MSGHLPISSPSAPVSLRAPHLRVSAEPQALRAARPANGPGANSFNGLDFAMGLFRLDAKWARVKMDWFDLGYSSPQFGVNLVPIQMVWFFNGP